MSSYRGHLVGGSILFVPFLLLLGALIEWRALSGPTLLLEVGILFGICLLFALWPDVDIKSRGQTIFYRLFFVFDVLLIATHRYEPAAYLGLFALLPIIGKHRGWTHTVWAAILLPAPFVLLPCIVHDRWDLVGLPYYGAAVTGYLSHLAADGLFWPKWASKRS